MDGVVFGPGQALAGGRLTVLDFRGVLKEGLMAEGREGISGKGG
jgi:hypothetical protein